MFCSSPGKQHLAEGGYPVEIKVNNNNNKLLLDYDISGCVQNNYFETLMNS